jgi:hypothetical protein
VKGRYCEIETQPPEGKACEVAKITTIKVLFIVRRIVCKLCNNTGEYVEREKCADGGKEVRFDEPGGAKTNRVDWWIKKHVKGKRENSYKI